MTASVHLENERPRWVELQRRPLPVGVTEEYLAVGADQAIAVAYAGASGKGVRIEVGDRRPPTLELRHESARRNSEDVAGEKQREVEEMGGGRSTNAGANERRPGAPTDSEPDGVGLSLATHRPTAGTTLPAFAQ